MCSCELCELALAGLVPAWRRGPRPGGDFFASPTAWGIAAAANSCKIDEIEKCTGKCLSDSVAEREQQGRAHTAALVES